MKKHWKWILAVAFVLVAAGLMVYPKLFTSAVDENKNPTVESSNAANQSEEDNVVLDTIVPGPNKVEVPNKAHVFLVENDLVSLPSNDKLQVTIGNIGDKLPKDTRFVLVPHDKTLTDEEAKHLKKYLDEKVSILFFGLNVDPQRSLDKLQVDKEAVWVDSNVELYFVGYGYGYSLEYDGYTQIYSKSTTLNVESLDEALANFVYKNRGF